MPFTVEEFIGRPDDLVEEERVVHIIACRTVALLDQARVSHVRLVVNRIQGAVATARESQLETKAIRTLRIHILLCWEYMAVQRRLRSDSVVQAIEADRALLQKN